jgi:hypothetical protein
MKCQMIDVVKPIANTGGELGRHRVVIGAISHYDIGVMMLVFSQFALAPFLALDEQMRVQLLPGGVLGVSPL